MPEGTPGVCQGEGATLDQPIRGAEHAEPSPGVTGSWCCIRVHWAPALIPNRSPFPWPVELMVLERGSPGIAVGTAWGRGCGSAARLAGSKRPLAPRGQGLQGIRAGLIRLGWIRGQGKQPVAWGRRFSRRLGVLGT